MCRWQITLLVWGWWRKEESWGNWLEGAHGKHSGMIELFHILIMAVMSSNIHRSQWLERDTENGYLLYVNYTSTSWFTEGKHKRIGKNGIYREIP